MEEKYGELKQKEKAEREKKWNDRNEKRRALKN
jgi:hypothetical protein